MSGDSRAERLAALVAEAELDCLFVGDLVRPGDSGPDAIANVRWLTGFTGTSGFAIVGDGRREFLTDFRYTERAASRGLGGVRAGDDRGTPASPSSPSALPAGSDSTRTRPASPRCESSRRRIPDGASLVPATGLVEKLRRIKDAEEIEAIAEASRLADEVFEWLAERGLAGRTEREVAHRARAADARARRRAVVSRRSSARARTARCRTPSRAERVIGAAELVVIDMGAQARRLLLGRDADLGDR